jgi:hypothetical protein
MHIILASYEVIWTLGAHDGYLGSKETVSVRLAFDLVCGPLPFAGAAPGPYGQPYQYPIMQPTPQPYPQQLVYGEAWEPMMDLSLPRVISRWPHSAPPAQSLRFWLDPSGQPESLSLPVLLAASALPVASAPEPTSGPQQGAYGEH